MRRTTSIIASVLLAIPVSAGNWYVGTVNCGGDGTRPETPFCTIQEGIDAAFADGGGEVRVAAGVYEGAVVFRPDVKLRGAGATQTIIEFYDESDPDFAVVTAADGTRMEDAAIRFSPDAVGFGTLIRIDNVMMEVENLVLDGGLNRLSTGIHISGPDSSDSRVRKTTIRGVEVGVLVRNSGLRITRCLFDDILRDGIFVEGPASVFPEIGDDGDISLSGFNRFRAVGGFGVNEGDSFFIRNTTGETLLAQVNDWGLGERDAIAARLTTEPPGGVIEFSTGPKGGEAAVFEPFIGKSIVPNSLFVRVLDAATSDFLPSSANLAVSLSPLGAGVEQDFDPESGLYFFAPLTPGGYTVTAEATGYTTAMKSATVGLGDLVGMVISMSKEGDGPRPGCRPSAGGPSGTGKTGGAWLAVTGALWGLWGVGAMRSRAVSRRKLP